MRVILFVIALNMPFCSSASLKADDEITLQKHCPPSFELTNAGLCEFRSLYQLYPSLANKGVGGLRIGLPVARDGFSPEQIDLGRYLFFDPALSIDGSLSCASCHDPDKGFSDGLARSIGVEGREVARSAPSLWNVGFLKKYFWDGRAHSLEEQMQGPLYADNEMGNSPENLLITLNAISAYRRLFNVAFDTDQITLEHIYTAIAAFESSLISLNSRYDRYAHGHHAALSDKEIEGLNVFRSFVARCAECHTPPLFTNQQIAVIGTPEPEGLPRDIGAQALEDDASRRGGFKVPSLRNIVKTAPYMHSGRFNTLREAASFYNEGRGHAVPKNEKLHIHWHIHEPSLTDDELDRIVDFLATLTDESFKPKRPLKVPSGLLLIPSENLQ